MPDSLDLNADVGEGFPYDEPLLRVITSANIACGFHAGDLATMRWLCGLCAEHGVAVGAQVSYRDREGFGRRPVEIAYDDLLADIVEQRTALSEAAASAGLAVAYLKPHGALYHRAGHDPEQARAVVAGAGGLPVLGPPGLVLLAETAEAGLRPVQEFFTDRGYLADGTLLPRGEPAAVLTDPASVAERVVRLVATGTVIAVDGTAVPVPVESICVHGDTADALLLATAVREALISRSVAVRRFA